MEFKPQKEVNYLELKKPYDAMVFIHGTDVIAVDSEGTKIASGTAGTDDSTVIQAACDALTVGTAYVQYAFSYTIPTKITIPENVRLEFAPLTPVKPGAAAMDMFYIKNGSQLAGCKIDVSDLIFTGRCIVVDSIEQFEAYNPTKIEDLYLYNDDWTGTAIALLGTNATAGHIFGVLFDNIRIRRFDYGISIVGADPSAGTNWINSNIFNNIWGYSSKNFIYMVSPDINAQIQSNQFNNITFQAGTVTQHGATPAIFVSGQYNTFNNLMVWDWVDGGGWYAYYLVFDALAQYNEVAIQTATPVSHTNDLGSYNTVIHTVYGSRYRTPNYQNGFCRVASTDRVYATLSGALSAITDAAAAKQYIIEVYGNIAETALITAKSYVDVVGFGANINITTNTNGAGVTFNNLVSSEWRHLLIRRNGTVTTESYVVSVLGTSDNTVKFVDVFAKNEITEAVNLCHGWSIAGTAAPEMYLCKGTGSTGGAASEGIMISGSAAPSVFGGDYTGGGSTSCHGAYLTGSVAPVMRGCRLIPGTAGYGAYINTTGAARLINCPIYSPLATAACYITTTAAGANLFSLAGCSIESASGASIECQTASILIPAYGCTLIGATTNVTSFAAHANNSGSGAGGWAAWTPTDTWGTADPASITTVARWIREGDIVHFHIDISSADSNATDSLTLTLPVDPVDNNDRTALHSIQKAGAGGATYSDPLAYIDMDSGSKLIKFYNFTAGTDGQAIAIIVSGSYEVP
jgi:hypothetical protein